MILAIYALYKHPLRWVWVYYIIILHWYWVINEKTMLFQRI